MKLDVTRGPLSLAIAVSAIVLLGSAGHSAAKPVKAKPAAAAKPFVAPNFTLTDTDGVKRTLSSYRGKPVALFFFCGCKWCHKTADQWGTMQKAGAIPMLADGTTPPTLVVFQGDANGAKGFEHETSLDPTKVTLLPDIDVAVTVDKYNAEPCPRVFILDSSGKVVYTNNHKDDEARVAPEALIVSRALSALQKASSAKKSTAG